MKNIQVSARYLLVLAITMFGTTAYSQQLVWPGDANNDGVVNGLDLIYVSLGFNTQGPVRSSVSIVWQGDSLVTWPDVLPDSTNYGYLDCNGNGFIDNDDVAAIEQNYGLIHGNPTNDSFPQPDSTSPLFYFFNLPDSLGTDSIVSIDVYAGSNNQPANFWGVAFAFEYNPDFIKAGSITVTPDDSISPPLQQVLALSVDDTLNGILDIALSRKGNSGGTVGNPILLSANKLVTISFIIEDNLIGKMAADTARFALSDIRILSQNLDKLSGQTTEVGIPLRKLASSAPSLQRPVLTIYPNPAQSSFTIAGAASGDNYVITDLTGRTLLLGQLNNTPTTVDCSALPKGMYLIQITNELGRITQKVLVD